MSKSRNRKQKRSRKHRGGAIALAGAPLSGAMDGWSQKMSASHGGDFLRMHAGQHGGAMMAGAPLTAIDQSGLSAHLRGSAMLGGLDRAFSNIAGLRDQAGGKRRTYSRKSKKNARKSTKRSHKSKKHSRTYKKNVRKTRRFRGGAVLGFAPLNAASMLEVDHSKAGLSAGWKGGVEPPVRTPSSMPLW